VDEGAVETRYEVVGGLDGAHAPGVEVNTLVVEEGHEVDEGLHAFDLMGVLVGLKGRDEIFARADGHLPDWFECVVELAAHFILFVGIFFNLVLIGIGVHLDELSNEFVSDVHVSGAAISRMHVVECSDFAEQEAVAVRAGLPDARGGVKHHDLLGITREEDRVREELQDKRDNVGIATDGDELTGLAPGGFVVHDGEGQLSGHDKTVPFERRWAAFGTLLSDTAFV